jgi:Zn-dependent peptidase ImmA (M78 family)
MWVASSKVARLMDCAETLETLTKLGNVLSDSIASVELDDRSRLAVEGWRNREPSAEAAVEIKLGPNQLALVPPGQTVASYFEVKNDGEYESPLLLVARMSAAVPLEYRQRILEFVRAVPATGVTELLEERSREAQNALPTYAERAHKQGELLAQWARDRFGLSTGAKADPEGILKELGVEIRQHHFGIEMIDAIGCWSPNHGPAVLVNLDGEHAHALPGRRATLAHELAHILVDRDGSLPAAEVLSDDAPCYPEQRASAFAAEFLLPKSVAAERIRSDTDIADAIQALRREFDVSRELAAWQVINGPAYAALSHRDQQLLRQWTANARDSALF